MVEYLSGSRIQGSSTKSGMIDGTGLKAYYPMNDTSSPIVNQAGTITGNSSIGTSANLAVVEGGSSTITSGHVTYNVTGSPSGLGNSIGWASTSANDGANAISSTASDWEFLHYGASAGSIKWTICFWLKYGTLLPDRGNNETLMSTVENDNTMKGLWIYLTEWNTSDVSELAVIIRKGDGSNKVLQAIMGADSTLDDGNWHFYSLTFDETLANTNLVAKRDNGVWSYTQNKTGSGSVSGAPHDPFSIQSNPTGNGETYLFPPNNMTEISIWNRVLTDTEITGIYNSGNGALLTVAGSTDEKVALANVIRVTNTATVAITAETGENEAMHSADAVRRVRQIFSTGHELIGDTITSITMNIKKGGSPTGTATVGIYDSSDDLKADFGSIDSATLTTSFVATTFNYVSGDSSIDNGESIQIRFSGGSSGNTVQWQMGTSTLSNTQGGYYDGSWTVRDHSATMSVTHGTASVESVLAGTRYEETDTRKIYRLKATSGSGDVTWDTATNSGMTISGNTVTGTTTAINSTTPSWVDRARTVEEFNVGDGLASITFQASQSGYWGDNEDMGFGSGTLYTSGNAATFIEYRMHFPDSPKYIQILENNASKGTNFGTWSSVKEYKITIDADGVVRYYLAPTSGAPMELIYTSLIPIAKGTVMYGHAVTGATGDKIVDVRYDFPDSWVEKGTA